MIVASAPVPSDSWRHMHCQQGPTGIGQGAVSFSAFSRVTARASHPGTGHNPSHHDGGPAFTAGTSSLASENIGRTPRPVTAWKHVIPRRRNTTAWPLPSVCARLIRTLGLTAQKHWGMCQRLLDGSWTWPLTRDDTGKAKQAPTWTESRETALARAVFF